MESQKVEGVRIRICELRVGDRFKYGAAVAKIKVVEISDGRIWIRRMGFGKKSDRLQSIGANSQQLVYKIN